MMDTGILMKGQIMDDQMSDQMFKLLQQIDARLVRIEQKIDQENRSEYDEPDSLFEEALQLSLLHDAASASLYQRYLEVGYARAARILDQIATAKLIGPGIGAKPRKVYKDKIANYLALMKQANGEEKK